MRLVQIVKNKEFDFSLYFKLFPRFMIDVFNLMKSYRINHWKILIFMPIFKKRIGKTGW